ncbi:MAG: trypsin-like peptidase domain-containing protein, partial [Planctomycetaceae bacterium]|nr:trypsin-like peptidase domain-containing protein [Planctomycetaceae bacterium]
MKLLMTCLVALTCATASAADVPMLQEASVTIHNGKGRASGTVITTGGKSYVWTAAHAVTEKDLKVVSNRKEYSCKVLKADQKRDIAVLELEAVLPSKVVWNFSKYNPGAVLLHVGNPFGKHPDSVAHGVFSNDRGKFYQASFAIYPGCSGGGVFNLDGEQVGIVVAHARHGTPVIPFGEASVTCPTLSFYIPSSSVLEFVAEHKLHYALGF